MLPLVALMVWLGVGSETFLPAIRQTNAWILERSRATTEIRVELRMPLQEVRP
jgi:hypothetical protein